MADDAELVACAVCFEPFGAAEPHVPRVVCDAGHSVCSACTDHLRRTSPAHGGRRCPTCRGPLHRDAPVNRALLEQITAAQRNLIALPRVNAGELDVDAAAPIGFGASADVYRARWGAQTVALKRLRIAGGGGGGGAVASAIQAELRVHASLRHPNVLTLFGATTWQTCPALVLEFADGGSLNHALYQAPKAPSDTTVYGWALDVAAALAYLHGRQVAHRDLKPANVLVCSGRAKLGDFGISRTLATFQQNTTVAGTPAYAAPELLQAGLAYGNQVDIYSLSVLVVELVARERPFANLNAAQTMLAVIGGRRPTVPPGMPPALQALVLRGWSAIGDDRPRAVEFVAALADAIPDRPPAPIPTVALADARAVGGPGTRPGESPESILSRALQLYRRTGAERDVVQAARLFRKAADLGNASAMTYLAGCYDKGAGVARDPAQAVALYRQAVDLGDTSAMVYLAILYQYGTGVERDPVQAVALYRRAADLGSVTAMTNLGECYEDGTGVEPDAVQAASLYRQAADRGHISAVLKLGHCYKKGSGVELNVSEAVRLYRRAADAGDSMGTLFLAISYENGDGVERDLAQAETLYRLFETSGDGAIKLTRLANSYTKDTGTGSDAAQGVRLYQRAVDLGSAAAMLELALCYRDGVGVERDPARAVELFRRAKDLGNVDAITKLADCYEKGVGVVCDPVQAVALYRQAVDLGDTLAMVFLAIRYEYGTGVERDPVQAVALYRRAADSGNVRAMTNLGDCYEDGTGVERDPVQAASLYRQAADLGDAIAMRKLGTCYENGVGLVRDIAMAAELYSRAARLGNEAAAGRLERLSTQN